MQEAISAIVLESTICFPPLPDPGSGRAKTHPQSFPKTALTQTPKDALLDALRGFTQRGYPGDQTERVAYIQGFDAPPAL